MCNVRNVMNIVSNILRMCDVSSVMITAGNNVWC